MTNYNERLEKILDGRVCPTCFRVVEITDESIIFDETIKSETLKQTLKCENKSCPTLYRAKKFGDDWYIDKDISKQAITSLTKEMVAEAKPGKYSSGESILNVDGIGEVDGYEGYNQAIDQFEQNLLKALEEV